MLGVAKQTGHDMEKTMSTTPTDQARAHQKLHEARADVQTAEAEIELARAKAWATFEHAVNGLAKHGCLENVTVTITDIEQDAATEGPGTAPTPATSANTSSGPATRAVKVGDVLQEVNAGDLPVGSQFTDCDGDHHVVTPSGEVRSGSARLKYPLYTYGPYTVTYVPPTVPEPVTLDRLPSMAEGSAIRSSVYGVLIAFLLHGNKEWRTVHGWRVTDGDKPGTLTLLHDAGADK